MTAGPEPPSGRQFDIVRGPLVATITEVGGGLRRFEDGGRPVLWPYREDEICSGGRGQVLLPWPNRLEDGTYSFTGVEAQAALDEPSAHNAIHGLVRWLNWDLLERDDDAASVGCTLAPQPGYPWRLGVRIDYALGDDGLTVTLSVRNHSDGPAPLGAGFHPYLDAGPGGVDGAELRFVATERLVTDDRGLPRGSSAVRGTEFDFGDGRALDGVRLDDCFTGLGPLGGEGVPAGAAWAVELASSSGPATVLWAGDGWRYVMCFTGDTLAPPDRRRAVALEPMTCPPNALRTGEALIVLEPAQSWSGRFGIMPVQG